MSSLSHFFGPISLIMIEIPLNSPLMAPKQVEMDGVIKRVHDYSYHKDAQDGEKSLIVVVGDHGMTDVSTSSFLLR